MSETLRLLLNDHESQTRYVARTAFGLSAKLERMTGIRATECQEFDVDHLSELYDPTLPTVAIDADHSFSGSELVGLVNSLNDQRRINVVYISAPAANMKVVDGTLRTEQGFIITAPAGVQYGAFPGGVSIDLIETVDVPLNDYLHKHGVKSVSSPDQARFIGNKQNLDRLAEESGIASPRRLGLDELSSDLDIVIKPSGESQGQGVFFGSRYPNDVEQWIKYYRFLEKHGYDPIIEERVRPWPLYDSTTGEQMDWNVRAIVCNGQFLDMYARIAPLDNPVNKSAGATSVPISQLSQYVGDKHQASVIIRSLENAAADFAERVESGVVGLDLTINIDGEVVMYEANVGNVGGLQTMAKLSDDYEEKIKNAYALLNIYEDLAYTARSNRDLTNPSASHADVPLTDSAKASYLDRTDRFDIYGHEIDITSPDTSSYLQFDLLIAQINRHLMDTQKVADTTAQIVEKFPLLLPRNFRRILFIGRLALGERIPEWVDADPKSVEFRYLSGMVAAREHNYLQAKSDYVYLHQAGEGSTAHVIQSEASISLQKKIDSHYPKSLKGGAEIADDGYSQRFNSTDDIVDHIDYVQNLIPEYFALNAEDSTPDTLLQLVGEASENPGYGRRLLGIITIALSEKDFNLAEILVEKLFDYDLELGYEFVCEYNNHFDHDETSNESASTFLRMLQKKYAFGDDYVSDL